MRSRESLLVFAIATANPECRVSSRSQTSQICRRQHHALIHTSAGEMHHDRRSTRIEAGIAKTRWSRCCASPSLPPQQIRHAASRHNHRRAKSFGGNFTHSHIRRCAPARSPFTKALQGQQTEFGVMRLLLSIKYPTIRCYRSSSQYQVTPHRMSCPCLNCLFLCGPLRRISVNARFYVQCCLVL